MASTSSQVRLWGALLVAFTAVSRSFAEERYQFTYRPVAVGERTSQDVRFGMKLRTTALIDGQTITSNRHLERHQRRTVEVLPRLEPKVARAKVTFDASDQVRTHATGIETRQPEPVSGKSYLILRTANDLLVTGLGGEPVESQEELIVRGSMEAFGKPNPLAQFLNGRTVAAGESLLLPQEVSGELFRSWEEMMTITGFSLVMVGPEEVGGCKCAVFNSVIRGVSKDDQQQPMILQGRLVIEFETCRMAALDMSGAVNLQANAKQNGQALDATSRGVIYATMRNLPVAATR